MWSERRGEEMTKKRVVSRSQHVDPSKVGKRAEAGTKRVYRGTIEAEWTCSSCGREHIPGSVKVCPSCGNPKDASEQYQAPSERKRYLTDEELKAMGVDPRLHLSDEECPYCGAKNKPGSQRCARCGAPLTDVGYTTRVCPACGRETNAHRCPSCGAETIPKEEAAPKSEPAPPSQPQPTSQTPFWRRKSTIIGAALAILMLVCGFFIFRPRTEVATVIDLYWERSIGVQEHQYNRHEGWDPPADADIESQEQRIHHHEQVLRGYEEQCGYKEVCTTQSVYDHTETICYDDGTCDEEDVYRDEEVCNNEYVCEDVPVYEAVPVYKTWYVYYVWEWVDLEPVTASGHDAYPRWPALDLAENQREKPDSRRERCIVTFENEKGKTFEYKPPCDELSRYDLGSRWRIKRTALSVQEVIPLGK